MRHLLLLAALRCALLAQTIEGTWQGTLTPPNQNDGIRLAFKIDKNGNTYQGTFSAPGPGFEPAKPDLEDVYFSAVAGRIGWRREHQEPEGRP